MKLLQYIFGRKKTPGLVTKPVRKLQPKETSYKVKCYLTYKGDKLREFEAVVNAPSKAFARKRVAEQMSLEFGDIFKIRG